jgi:hypothetical protein
MTRRLVVITTFATLALPAAALAKEPVKATVCGANGCASSEDRAAILPLVEGGPPASTPPASGAPAYRVRVTIAFHDGVGTGRRATDTFTNWMSPTVGLVRGSNGTWLTMPAATLAALRRIARGIRPFPAARLPLGPSQTHAPAPAPTPAPATAAGIDGTLVGAIVVGALVALACAGVGVARRRRGGPPSQAAPVS